MSGSSSRSAATTTRRAPTCAPGGQP